MSHACNAVWQLGTILLVALPLGAVLCFFDLLGARALARGEVRTIYVSSIQLGGSMLLAACLAAGGFTEHVPRPIGVPTRGSCIPHIYTTSNAERGRSGGWAGNSARTVVLSEFVLHGECHRSPALWRDTCGE